jgi:hypothetical protein
VSFDDDDIGFDWHDAFGGLHEAGGAVLSAFGAGAVVKPLEQLESPILPDWAKTATKPGAAPAPPPPQKGMQNAQPKRTPSGVSPSAPKLPPPPHSAFAWIKAHPIETASYSAIGLAGVLLLVRVLRPSGGRR